MALENELMVKSSVHVTNLSMKRKMKERSHWQEKLTIHDTKQSFLKSSRHPYSDRLFMLFPVEDAFQLRPKEESHAVHFSEYWYALQKSIFYSVMESLCF